MPPLAVLDLDGTLVDSLDDITASVNHALAKVGLSTRSRGEVRGWVGEGARVLVSRAVAPREHLVEAAFEAWRTHYEAHCLDRTRPFPGIEAALAASARILAVHTNKPGVLARKILAGLGLLPRFAAVLGGDEAPRKPDPAGLRLIMSRVGAGPHETVFIGDSPVDLATARAVGVAHVGVTWGLVSRADLALAGATMLVDAPADLASFLV